MSPLGRLFARVSLAPEVEADLRALADRGSVVFVMPTAGWLNQAYVRWLARRLGLPPVRAVLGTGGIVRLLLGWRGALGALRRAVTGRTSALVFLRRPRALAVLPAPAADPFPALVHRQRDLPHPVFLVPLLFVWSRRVKHIRPSVFDVLFGSSEVPGALATLVGFLRSHRRAFVRTGRPIDLRAFLAERSGEAPAALARKVRGVLAYYLGRELRAVLGPPFKTAARVRAEVLGDLGLRETIDAVAAGSGRPRADVAAEARRHVRAIAADMTPTLFEVLRPIVTWICNRLYDGIEVDEAGLDTVRRAAAAGSLVLCPSHKSHMDYVILTYLFYTRGLLPPHVAAGDNLAFFPFGALARRCGGFFIRRSFRGDRVYAAVLRAYVRRLQRDGFPQEFFIEGSRSRTGKLLPPKTGLLSMQVDAWLDGGGPAGGDDVTFVPVAIDYERLAEARSHARELGGAAKASEDLGALVRARKVLRSRHGRIYIQFGAPISLALLRGGRGGDARDEAERRAFVHRLAIRIAHGIDQATTVTAVGLLASAVLADGEAGVLAPIVAERVDLLRSIARARGARMSEATALAPADPREPGPIGRSADLFVGAGIVRRIGEDGDQRLGAETGRRPELDFHRNAVVHRFVAPALFAAGLLASGSASTGDQPRRRARWLSRLFKIEFLYQPGVPFDTTYDETHALLDALGVLAAPGRLRFLASFLHPYLEAYRTAALVAATWTAGDRRSFVSAALERGRADLETGRIRLPESVSKTTLENAAAWMLEEGLISAADPSGDAVLHASGEQRGRTAALAQEIAACLVSGSDAS